MCAIVNSWAVGEIFSRSSGVRGDAISVGPAPHPLAMFVDVDVHGSRYRTLCHPILPVASRDVRLVCRQC